VLEALLLQGFVDGVGAVTSALEVTVDVEGHGRTNVQDVERYYSTIGWFTSVEQVDIAPGAAESFTARARAAQDRLADSVDKAPDARDTLAELCFNFLGAFTSPVCPGLDWEAATEPHGPTRSGAVDRVYACRLTARISGGRLTIDLVHDLSRVSAAQAERIVSVLRQRLGGVVARESPMGDLTREYQSTSGLLLLSRAAAAVSSTSESRPVLVTGATGYLGLHLIHQMLRSGALQPICLVRGASEAAARNRVLELYARYFGTDAAARASRQASFVCGDIREPNLGLPRSFEQKVTAVFHLAADTHLLGRSAELSKTNEGGTRRIVDWVAEHGGIPLHYVSTLAVAGKVPVSRGFDETDFNIGQGFLSPYEASKFEAESVVRDSRSSRSATYIYRMGHLAPDSRTGLFQANLGDNRVYQMLKSYALAGEIADDDSHSIAFSHVDIVASAIATIARSPHVPAGVFHVESPHTVQARELALWLSRIGYRVSAVSPAQFTDSLVKRVARQDEVLASAALQWAERSKRNVVYDSARTLATLSQLDIAFPRPDADWFARAIELAIDEGFMPAPDAGPREHEAPDGRPSELG
jgi:thioester reductase-like protein